MKQPLRDKGHPQTRGGRTGGPSVDVDAVLRLPQRPHTDSWLRADARGCESRVRQELATAIGPRCCWRGRWRAPVNG
jgi:hypothetical protein